MGGIILNVLATILGTLIVIFAVGSMAHACFILMLNDRVDLAKKMLIRIPLMVGLVVVGMLLASCGVDARQWATTGKAFLLAIGAPLTIQFSVVIVALAAIIRGLCAIVSTKMSLKKKVAE